VIHYNKQTKL